MVLTTTCATAAGTAMALALCVAKCSYRATVLLYLLPRAALLLPLNRVQDK